MSQLIWGKFFKAFITGGISAVSGALALGVTVHSLEEAKHVIAVLAIAFLSGAFHAAWNAYMTPSTT